MLKNFLRIWTIALSLVILLSAAAFGEQAISVSLQGEDILFPDTQPVRVQDRVLVPARFIFEKLGATMEYSEFEGIEFVRADFGERKIIFVISSSSAFVDNEQVELDVPAQLIGDRTMIPLRFVLETFGFSVDYTETDSSLHVIVE